MQIGKAEGRNLNQLAFDVMPDFRKRLPQSDAFKADVDRLLEYDGDLAAMHAVCYEAHGGDAEKNTRGRQQVWILFHRDTPVSVPV